MTATLSGIENISPEHPIRVINHCRRCKTTWAQEYSEYGHHNLVRVDADGKRHTQMSDARCPVCRMPYHVKSAIVRGTVSDNPCSPSCVHAVGALCACACGGKNHGAAHLVSATKAVA